jgi:hypothetical protein
MRFYPKIQKYEFGNLPQNNRLKRRSTRVDHVSKVRFEIGGLDLCRFEKNFKNSLPLFSFSFVLSFFFFFLLLSLQGPSHFLLLSLKWGASSLSSSSSSFFFEEGHSALIFFTWGAHLRPTCFKWRVVRPFKLIYLFIFNLYSFLFYIFFLFLITLN